MAKSQLILDGLDERDRLYLAALLRMTPGGHGHLTDIVTSSRMTKKPKKPKYLWALVAGEYSDFHVVGICLSKKDAKAAKLRINADANTGWDKVDLVKYPVLDGTVRRVDVLHLSVTVWDNGKVERGYGFREDSGENIRREWNYENPTGLSWSWVRAPMHNGQGGRLDIQGTDHNRVRKVYSELLGRLRDQSDPLHLETSVRRP